MSTTSITAVLWDFGGVILTSPFEAFNRYETERGLPTDTIRRINSINPDTNAWALLERSEVTPEQFNDVFAAEAAQLGYEIPGRDILALLSGDVRPRMVAALDTVIEAGFRTACLTNNVVSSGSNATHRPAVEPIIKRFHAVIESSKVGVRKPETRFYEIACETLDVSPEQCVFLDDLGINLKPAAAMGMRTIKVVDPDAALDELSSIIGIQFPMID